MPIDDYPFDDVAELFLHRDGAPQSRRRIMSLVRRYLIPATSIGRPTRTAVVTVDLASCIAAIMLAGRIGHPLQ